MARTFYGGSPADVIVKVTTDDGDYGPATGTFTVWTARTGGSQETNLLDAGSNAVTVVSPDAAGRVQFFGADGYTAAYYLQDSNGNRWRMDPSDLASRTSVATVLGFSITNTGTPGQVLMVTGTDTAAWTTVDTATPVDIAPTISLTVTAITSSTATLNYTIEPGTHEVQGVYFGRDAVGALAAFEATTMDAGLTGSRVFNNLPSGSAVTLYVKPVIDGVIGTRVDTTVTTTTAASAPTNTVAPAISGLAQVGQTLSVTQGTWTGGPTAYAYQWKADGVNISGATSATRVLAAGQQDAIISCAVTATNAVGSTTALSNETAAVAAAPASPPANTALPTITGTPKVGTVLTSTLGTWTNSPSLTRQWQGKEATSSTWVNIPGATAATYTPVSTDAGDTLRVVVTGSNSAGSASATSAATGTVAPLTSTGFTVPSGYNLYYGRDFTVANTADDANWARQTGAQSNNPANFTNAANVVKSGANGQELIANRTADGATVFSGRVSNFDISLPQYFYLKATIKFMNFGAGSWPSLWARPQPGTGDGEGELDFMEAFGGHIGSGLRVIASTLWITPYDANKVAVNGSDWGMSTAFYGSAGVYGTPMVIECRKVPNSMTTTVNGVLKSTINRQSATGARWDSQFEDPAKRWYVRLDHQAGGGEAGAPKAGWRESRQAMTELVIGIPNA